MATAGVKLLESILKHHFGQCHSFSASSRESFEEAWKGTSAAVRLFYSDCPDASVAQILVQSGMPIFAFVDAPTVVVGDIVARRREPWRACLATASLSLCALRPVLVSASTLMVTAAHGAVPMVAMVEWAGQMLRVPLDESGVSRICSDLMRDEAPFATFADFCELSKVDVEVGARPDSSDFCIDAALAFIGDFTEIIWHSELFLLGDAPGESANAKIDLTGTPRVIIYGPYLCLPKGTWLAQFHVSIADNLVGVVMRVEFVFANQIAASGTVDLQGNGGFTCELPVDVVSSVSPIEVRFVLSQAALSGVFELHRISFRPINVE
jgi:hypothetical protein